MICVGRVVYQKGFDLMLNIWSEVVKSVKEWQLYILVTETKVS